MFNFLHKMKADGLLLGRGRALDVGCGEGKFSRILAEWGYDVDAIDSSAEKMIKEKGFDIHHKSTEEGKGQTYSGALKYWNIHKFICVKP